jgi:hypothetical protein
MAFKGNPFSNDSGPFSTNMRLGTSLLTPSRRQSRTSSKRSANRLANRSKSLYSSTRSKKPLKESFHNHKNLTVFNRQNYNKRKQERKEEEQRKLRHQQRTIRNIERGISSYSKNTRSILKGMTTLGNHRNHHGN